MNKTNLVPYVLEKYQQGQRYFKDLDMENESFEGQNLEDIVFEDWIKDHEERSKTAAYSTLTI